MGVLHLASWLDTTMKTKHMMFPDKKYLGRTGHHVNQLIHGRYLAQLSQYAMVVIDTEYLPAVQKYRR